MDINWEAWGRNALAFISEHDMASEFKEWCGGWPIPETDNAAARAHAAKPDALVDAAREAVEKLEIAAHRLERIHQKALHWMQVFQESEMSEARWSEVKRMSYVSGISETATTLRAALGDGNE